MNEIINTNKGIRDGTDMIFDNKSNNGNDLSSDTILLSNLTVYETTEWKEEKINGRIEILPEDWDKKSIKEISKINFGQRITKKNNIGASLYPVVGSGNESFKTSTYNRENEITIGRFALSKKCINKHKMKFFLNDSGMTLSSYIDNQKLLEFLLFHNENLIYNCARGRAQKNMDMKEFSNLKFILPISINEQNKIRELLTKQDNIIENIDKRIEKTKKIIKYYQQELLSGRLRLREVETINGKEIVVYENSEWKEEKINGRVEVIPEDWDKQLLSNILNFEKGKNAGKYTQEFIVKNNGFFNVYSGKTENNGIFGKTNCYEYDEKEILFITTVGDKAMSVKLLKGKFSLSQNCALLRNNTENNTKYLFYITNKTMIIEKKYLPQGIKPSFRKSDMDEKEIIFTNNLNEQILIRDFLTKLEDNLENLQNLKNKEEKTFKFLQQEFLSGKLRLK